MDLEHIRAININVVLPIMYGKPKVPLKTISTTAPSAEITCIHCLPDPMQLQMMPLKTLGGKNDFLKTLHYPLPITV